MIQNLLHDIMGKCKKKGAHHVEVAHHYSRSSQQSVRLQKPDESENQESAMIGLKILINQKEASVSSANFLPQAIDDIIERVFAMAEYLPQNPFAGPAEPQQLCKNPQYNLESFDKTEPSAQELRELAMAMEDVALSQPKITNSSGAGVGYGTSQFDFCFSNGFQGSLQNSGFSMSVAVLAEENGNKETDYASASRVFWSDLPSYQEIGLLAAKRAVSNLGAIQEIGGKFPVVFDKRIAGALNSYVIGGINGQAIAKGTSFLQGKINEKIMNAGITITDDPFVIRGLASQPFDGEGLTMRATKLIDKGILTQYLLDLASARQLKMQPTGNAMRSLTGVRPGTTNLRMENGDLCFDELIKDIKIGFLVNSTMGFGVNMVTGDYSQGASGFWIINGEVCHAVNEMTIAGNLMEMFQNMTIANDREAHKTNSAPSIRIDGITIAGK